MSLLRPELEKPPGALHFAQYQATRDRNWPFTRPGI